MKIFGVAVVICPCPKNWGASAQWGQIYFAFVWPPHYSDMLFMCFFNQNVIFPTNDCIRVNGSTKGVMRLIPHCSRTCYVTSRQLLGDLWTCQAVTSLANDDEVCIPSHLMCSPWDRLPFHFYLDCVRPGTLKYNVDSLRPLGSIHIWRQIFRYW